MNRNTIVVVNAGATYARMLLTVFFGLLSSRWILAGLGQIDYGLFAVVGGIMGFLTFLNSSLAGSAQRHFAYAIGRGELDEVRRWFNASLSVHICLATAVICIGLPVGDWLLHHVLAIPAERLQVCVWVFRCALLSSFFSITAVPFTGMFTAKQRIMELAVFGLAGSLLTLLLAHSLLAFRGDRLLLYAIGVVGISLIILVAQIIRLAKGYPECKIVWSYWWDRQRVKELTAFAGWTLFGTLGNLGRFQGMALLMNVFHGVRINSALGIANQAGGQMEMVSQGMFNALAPEITASEGRGERSRMVGLALRASKFSVLLTMIPLIPLFFELDTLLGLWLREVPLHTAAFCRIVLLMFFVEKFTAGYMVAISAHGRIAAYQATLGGVLLLTFPMAWLVLHNGGSPEMALGCALVTGAACSLGRVFWVRHLLGVSVGRWLREVILPCTLVALPTIAAVSLIHSLLAFPWMRVLAAFCGGGALSVGLAWILGLDTRERQFVGGGIKRAVRRLVGGGRSIHGA